MEGILVTVEKDGQTVREITYPSSLRLDSLRDRIKED